MVGAKSYIDQTTILMWGRSLIHGWMKDVHKASRIPYHLLHYWLSFHPGSHGCLFIFLHSLQYNQMNKQQESTEKGMQMTPKLYCSDMVFHYTDNDNSLAVLCPIFFFNPLKCQLTDYSKMKIYYEEFQVLVTNSQWARYTEENKAALKKQQHHTR